MKVHYSHNNQPVLKTEYGITFQFQIPPTDSRFKETRFLGHYTVNAITPTTTLRFYIEPLLGGQTWDLGEPFFMSKLKVTDQEDNQLAEDTEASTVNMTLFSALKEMKLYVNE